ncbi:alpha/beta fold hydrolase [Mucilaginibacter lacusdianchii]|uniref:alpha/beta fold hydrolase n=1 Tax=Mucilaginibacter lacusdianchii TaxID=2684211 RepID=UPI00131B1B8D|nr:alpha/beta hydrolase [Mucilaginibacter sp. JXJ CY 39]
MDKLKTPLKIAAVAMVAAFGRYPVSWLFSKKSGKHISWPKPGVHHWVKCASGNEFYVEFDGPVNAQPIVFIHGLNATRQQWYYQRKYFKKTHRLVFIDLPGHGNSAKANDLTVATLAADLKRVLGFLHVHNPIIYGHSWGSSIVMQYCLLAGIPLNAKAVILHGGPYTNPLKTIQLSPLALALEKPVIVPTVELLKKAAPLVDVVNKLYYSSGITTLLARFAYFTGKQTAAQLRYTAQMAPQCKTKAVTGGLLKLFNFELTEQLKTIKIPTLVVGSLNDKVHRYECSQFIHEQIPNSSFVTVDGGHQSMVENHKTLNQAIDMFIQSIG